MITARNIRKTFGNLEVLKGIDINIEPRRVTAIVGPSGAGKTTLLQIIGTLMTPDRGGSVLYDGTEVTALGDSALSRFRNLNIGFVFQFHRLLPEFTLVENVAMPALIAGVAREEAFDRARRLLERLDLKGRDSHKPSELSGGECQRGAVARALINNPKIILADEPSGSLDSQNRTRLHKLFFELRDELETGFAIVTHDESLASDADVVIHMADGKIKSII
ncbi:MAG: ABC transporter ATP-binding protein [Muribaculaceae bacterium]|nr:ABC transporter ATP-binding protein [Muribaculaceae bacterium]